MGGIELGQIAVIVSLVGANFALIQKIFALGRVVEKMLGHISALQSDLKKLEERFEAKEKAHLEELEAEVKALRGRGGKPSPSHPTARP